MRAGLIEDGYVDERSIVEVTPADLAGFDQCHFFAGIGGWPLALRMAGVSPFTELWTGSCPCQPFSASGQRKGFDDERHLWPFWLWLISQCGPAVVLGEQVASKDAEPWFDLVHADLEAIGYAFGCVPFPAASVGAPHIRDRAYWVGHAGSARSAPGLPTPQRGHEGLARVVDNASSERIGAGHRPSVDGFGSGGVAHDDGFGCVETRECLVSYEREQRATRDGRYVGADQNYGFWRDADWIGCADGKWRPVEPGTFPLAHGIPDRVELLRAYGNAIVPQQAALFIEAVMETLQ